MSQRIVAGIALAVVVLIAGWFRFYDITAFPGGLFPDEAANGEDALLILDGDWRAFYPRGNGREALFFFLEALSIKLFGIGVWQLHVVSAAIGTATVAALYFATRVWFGRLSGLLASLFLATSAWHVTLSRTGFRAILIPLFVALFTAWVGYLIVAVKEKQQVRAYVYAVLAGAAFAGGFYTYIAYRVMIGVVAGIAVLLLLAALHPKIGFPHITRYWRHILVALAAALIVFVPLGLHFLQAPDAIVGRAGQVSVFNPDLQREVGGGTLAGTLLYSTRETLRSFFAGSGDSNWRHAVPGFPLLNPLVGLLSLLGLAWAIHGTVTVLFSLVRGREVHLGMIYPYLLLLLVGMLLPVITTAEGLPHGLRSIGLIVPLFLLAGTAASVILYWLKLRVGRPWQSVGFGLVVGLVLIFSAYDAALYFAVARRSAEAAYAYRSDLTVVASYIREQADNETKPFLVLDEFSLQSVHFLTNVAAHDHTVGREPHPDEDEHLWRQVDPATSHLVELEPGELIIFTQSTLPDADRYAREHADVEEVVSQRNQFGEEIMRVYMMPAAPAAEPGSLDA